MEEEVKREDPKKSGMPVAALTLGILSIVTAFFWYITLPTGILAIIFGVKSAKKMGSKLGKAGIITGIIGLVAFANVYMMSGILIILSNL